MAITDPFPAFIYTIHYIVENFPCFPTVCNIPRVIFNGFQDILLETWLGRESSLNFPYNIRSGVYVRRQTMRIKQLNFTQ